MLLEMEVYQTNTIIKNKKLYLPRRAKDVAYFLSEGQIYLNMAKILHKRNQKISAMFAIMLKAMDIYSKLKMHLRENYSIIDEEELNSEEDSSEEDSDDWYYHDIPFVDEMLNEVEENEEEDVRRREHEIEIDICVCCLTEIHYREFLMANIELLITRFKNLCIAFTGSSSTLYTTLYLTLRDYCERVRLFLHNTRTTAMRQERSSRDDCHKYALLKQLLEHVSKEQESVARYADIKENEKFNS